MQTDDKFLRIIQRIITMNNIAIITARILQPTSPLRSAHDIISGYNEFEEKHADSVTAVCGRYLT